jgi:hypothetical protein
MPQSEAVAAMFAVAALMVAGPIVKVMALVVIASWDSPIQTVNFKKSCHADRIGFVPHWR